MAGREGPRRAAGPVPSAQLQPPGGQSPLVRFWPCLNGLEEWRLSCNVSGGPGTLPECRGCSKGALSEEVVEAPHLSHALDSGGSGL